MKKVFKTREEYQQWIDEIRKRGGVDAKSTVEPIATYNPWTGKRDFFYKRNLEVVLNCHDGQQEIYTIFIDC